MKYQAFTNDSLAMMHHGARGALAVDDELSKLGEEPRFKVRSTSDWAEHAADLETEMLRRGMSFEPIDLSATAHTQPVVEEPASTAPSSTGPDSIVPSATSYDAAEPDLTSSVSSESAPTAPALPNSAMTPPVPESPKPLKTSEIVDNAIDQDTRLRSRIAAVLKIRS
jgi:hypothetical protein